MGIRRELGGYMKDIEIEAFVNSIMEKKYDFKHEVIPVMEEMFIINGLPFRRYDLLSIVCKLIDENKLEDAENLLKMAEELYSNKSESTSFNRIAEALYDLILYEDMKKDEIYYQEVFKKHCKEILGEGYTIYEKKDLLSKRPDAWVSYEDKIIPVEMKKGNFNSVALKQLQDYMTMYDCSYGIAIGHKTTVEIPDNITFIKMEDVKRYDD